MTTTTEQPDTFAYSTREREQLEPEYPEGFWEWLTANEPLYRAFADIALHAKRHRGFPRWGSHAILEHLRWDTALRDGYQYAVKINNNAGAGLARLAMAEHPELVGFFATRRPPAASHAIRLNGEPYRDPDEGNEP